MRSHKKVFFQLFVVLVVAVVTVTAALRSQNNGNTSHPTDQLPADDNIQPPIVDYNSPEPTDPEKRAKRKAKSKRYDRKYPAIGPGITWQGVYHWPEGFPRLPVRQSNAIVIGAISDASAHLSDDKGGVYSEFVLFPDQVLKDDSVTPLKPGNEIVLERDGGRVRYSSAKVGQFSFIGLGMPRVQHRYVLFLTRNQPEEDFHILTGYELRDGRVFPLDSSPGVVHFEIYENSSQETFLNDLVAAIAAGPQVSPK